MSYSHVSTCRKLAFLLLWQCIQAVGMTFFRVETSFLPYLDGMTSHTPPLQRTDLSLWFPLEHSLFYEHRLPRYIHAMYGIVCQCIWCVRESMFNNKSWWITVDGISVKIMLNLSVAKKFCFYLAPSINIRTFSRSSFVRKISSGFVIARNLFIRPVNCAWFH